MRRRFNHPDQFRLDIPNTEQEPPMQEASEKPKRGRNSKESLTPPAFLKVELNGEPTELHMGVLGTEEETVIVRLPDGEDLELNYDNVAHTYVPSPGNENLLNQPIIDALNEAMIDYRLRKSETKNKRRTA